MKRVAVAGAGLGGLSAALRLAASGYRVAVYDRRQGPGGKAFSEQIGAYRFDTGPSLFTMPEVFDQLFDEAGLRREDYFSILPLDPICRYQWNDGTVFEAPPGTEGPGSMAEAVVAELGEERDAVERFFRHIGRIHATAAELFLWKSLSDAATYRSRTFWRALPRLPLIDPLRSMDSALRRFFRNPRTVQLFNRYATYNGSDPFRVPATLLIIPRVEYGGGGYAVEGGIYAVPQAIERACREWGVEFHYGTEVERILYRSDRSIEGLQVEGEKLPADLVVCNADVDSAYRVLLRDQDAPLARRYRRLEPSSSGMVFYWGMRRAFPELRVNNIFFSDDYRREFEQIFRRREIPGEPTIYVNITSKVTPDDAPEGGENWFVLCNVPPDTGQDWQREAEKTRDAVTGRLSRLLGTDVESAVAEEGSLLPPEIERLTGSTGGRLYGIASNSRLAAFLRHPGRSRRYPGLYFTGGSVHPGGGMPLTVLSGKIAADLVRHADAHKLRNTYST
jgi:phytoene desaturase